MRVHCAGPFGRFDLNTFAAARDPVVRLASARYEVGMAVVEVVQGENPRVSRKARRKHVAQNAAENRRPHDFLQAREIP